MNTKAPPRGSGVAGELFHPDDNHYMNTLIFNYKIHDVIQAFTHSHIHAFYYHRYSFHPDDNHYLNTLTFNYKIHVEIQSFTHSIIHAFL